MSDRCRDQIHTLHSGMAWSCKGHSVTVHYFSGKSMHSRYSSYVMCEKIVWKVKFPTGKTVRTGFPGSFVNPSLSLYARVVLNKFSAKIRSDTEAMWLFSCRILSFLSIFNGIYLIWHDREIDRSCKSTSALVKCFDTVDCRCALGLLGLSCFCCMSAALAPNKPLKC